ncbi:MAG: hypothetical protein ACFFD2_19385 [Promethearchaeota archaeon]
MLIRINGWKLVRIIRNNCITAAIAGSDASRDCISSLLKGGIKEGGIYLALGSGNLTQISDSYHV